MERTNFIAKISSSFKVHDVVALLGPRQCGKTTLARMYFEQRNAHESPSFVYGVFQIKVRLDTPKTTLDPFDGLVVIDEIPPKVTRSMTQAIVELQLDALAIVYPGSKPYSLSGKIQVRPVEAVGT